VTRILQTTPVFTVADVAVTMHWYQDHLGFHGDAVPRNPPHNFAILRRDDIEIMLQRLDGYQKPDLYQQRPGGIWNVYLRTDGVRALYERVSSDDAIQIVEPLHVQPYGQMEFVVQDPNGYTLVFAEPA